MEVCKDIKAYTELNGRFDSNLIDTLNGLYNYDVSKEKLQAHMESNELSFLPFKQSKRLIASKVKFFVIGANEKYGNALNIRSQIKIESIHQLQSPTINSNSNQNHSTN